MKNGPSDGTTLAFVASSTLVARLGRKDFPFDPLVDLAPISLAGIWPMGFAASPKLGIETFGDYLAWVKAGGPERGKLGITASDAFIDAFNRMFASELGVAMQPISYRGALPMVNDLADGRLPAAVSGIVSLVEYHRGQRLRLLMVTSHKRLKVAPDVPTARELKHGQARGRRMVRFLRAHRHRAEADRRMGSPAHGRTVRP